MVSRSARPNNAIDEAASIAVVRHLVVTEHGLHFLHAEGAPGPVQPLHRVAPVLEGLFAAGDDVSLRGYRNSYEQGRLWGMDASGNRVSLHH